MKTAKKHSALLLTLVCCLSLRGEDIELISRDHINSAIISLIKQSTGYAESDDKEINRTAGIWAHGAASEFAYLSGKFPRGMAQEFIKFNRDVEMSSGGGNKILLFFDDEKVKKLSNLELAALFTLVKKGFPIVSRTVPIKEKVSEP